MKQFIQFIEVIIIAIGLFLLLPEISNWIATGSFSITMRELREAVFLGIFTPTIIYFLRKIQNDAVFVLFVVLVIVLIVSAMPHFR
ncbi:hypothetical protein SAMN05444274_106169 [Mariniphaga anaerophila]|uniref:Uncharacterized protein n=1 Tax=Mariniphaga anaerophila TaxID=1484053 RepID=A0A1M5CKX6_9BACT|nr:hypothetical protein [Mariniphaga anaerophila]SHF55351.1 hypothetical protein SAMN05444274_106169 [Mariniphaga anaerophila]